MAIEQMKLLSITGKDSNLESFLANQLINCGIQIEDAKKIYDKGWKFEYYEYDYRVKDYIKRCLNIINKFEIDDNLEAKKTKSQISLEDIDVELNKINEEYENSLKIIENLERRNNEIKEFIEPIKKLRYLNIEAKKLYEFKYLKFRFGNVPNENIEEIRSEVENLDVVFFEVERTDDVTWILYFTTEEFVGTCDGFFNMQKFNRIRLPEDLQEKPNEYIKRCNSEIVKNEELIEKEKNNINEIKKRAEEVLPEIYSILQIYEKINNLKKYIVKDQNNNFYIVVWVPNSNMNKIINLLNNSPGIDFVVKDAKGNMKAPTKLRNFAIFKPFEAIVKMYGMPNISELDPTPFVAIVTCLIFGIMFGDIGHGAIIFLARIIYAIQEK